jgi:hypothetical protein
MSQSAGVAKLTTDDGVILAINLDSKEWQDAYDYAVQEMRNPKVTETREVVE